MRHIFLLFIFFQFIFYYSALSQKNYKDSLFMLSGKLKDSEIKTAILWYPSISGKYIRDTTSVINSSFCFKGTLSQPSFTHLIFPSSNRKSISFFLETGNQNISIDDSENESFRLSGSFTQNQDNCLKDMIKTIDNKYKSWIDEYRIMVNEMKDIKDSSNYLKYEEKIKQIQKRNEVIAKETLNAKLLFISKNIDSYVSPTYLYGLLLNKEIKTDSALM